jgi:hypothetical protein
MILKNARHLSDDQEINRLWAAILLVSCCNYLIFRGACISNYACTFSGLASIPRLDTIKTQNLPEDTSKAHLEGFSVIP